MSKLKEKLSELLKWKQQLELLVESRYAWIKDLTLALLFLHSSFCQALLCLTLLTSLFTPIKKDSYQDGVS